MHRLFEPSPVRYLYYALGNVENFRRDFIYISASCAGRQHHTLKLTHYLIVIPLYRADSLRDRNLKRFFRCWHIARHISNAMGV